MTLNLTLPPDLEQRLQQETRRQGTTADEYALRLLNEHLPPKEPAKELVDLLQSWIDGEDAEDQQETGNWLVRVLDEDRPSDRELFPRTLKGVTW